MRIVVLLTHNSYIFGTHVGEYMEYMEEEDKSMYDQLFARYLKAGITGEEGIKAKARK